MSDICHILFCKNTTDAECSGVVIGAAEGTYCGLGKICIQGKCTTNPLQALSSLSPHPSNPLDDCPVSENFLIASNYYERFLQRKFGFTFPKAQMTCQEILDYSKYELNQAASAYCENSNFRKTCCSTCKSKTIF